jgi:hypothetical protein
MTVVVKITRNHRGTPSSRLAESELHRRRAHGLKLILIGLHLAAPRRPPPWFRDARTESAMHVALSHC